MMVAHKGGKNKQDTTFTVKHPSGGSYNITVSVRAHGRVSKVPKVGASAEKISRNRGWQLPIAQYDYLYE